MEVTDVRLYPPDPHGARLGILAYCAVCFDNEFAVNSCRIINRAGKTFVAMPANKSRVRCSSCQANVPYDSKYCSNCGNAMSGEFVERENRFHDIAHPINGEFRARLEDAILAAYEARPGFSGPAEPG